MSAVIAWSFLIGVGALILATSGAGGHSFWKNLKSSQVIDTDPFSVNQIGHPYQGSIYYGLARSAGLNYWQSLAYSLAGLSYNFLGHARFGAVEWRTDDATGR